MRLLARSKLPFTLTLVTNASVDSNDVIARTKPAGAISTYDDEIELAWPGGLFSLSHVAIPFPPDDPVYGGAPQARTGEAAISLGSIIIRGERNLLLIPDNYFRRLRYNPFFAYLSNRVLAFLGL